MSKMQRAEMGASGLKMLWQLPEMVSSLQKDVFFFQPEEMITQNEYKVG